MKNRSPRPARLAMLALLAALSACSKTEAPPPPPAPAPTAETAASAPVAATSAPAMAASAAASPASAAVASTDVDDPTPLPSKELKGAGTRQKVSYYWRFDAPVGPLTINATAKNSPSGAANALRFGLYDLKANQICSDSHGNTNTDKTVTLKCNVEKAQPVVLRLDLSEETIDYAVQIDGPIELPAPAASAAAKVVAGPGSTDVDAPTKLKTNRIRGDGPRKAASYYYTFNAGPGDLTLTLDGRNVPAATAEALMGGLYTLRSEKLCEAQLGNTTLEKRAVTTCKLEKRQPVILRLDVSAETVDFRARFDGAHDFEDYVAPKEVVIALDASVLFDTGSSTIKPEARKTLDEAAARLKKHGEVPVTITGHADGVGNDAANQVLSHNRAAAVRDYFVGQASMPSSRFAIKGLGKTQPVADNATEPGRQRNRRVEVQFTPK